MALHVLPVARHERRFLVPVRATPRDAWATLTILLAVAVPVLVGVNEPFARTTIGAVISLALTPVWLTRATSFVGARLLGVLVLICLLSAPLLAQWMAATHLTDGHTFREALILLLGSAACVGALLWCRTILPTGVVAALYGVGMFAAVALHPNPLLASSPWRWGLGLPTTVVVLAVVLLIGNARLELAAVAALAVANALAGGRSDSGILLMVAVLVIWQRRPRLNHRSTSAFATVLLIGMLGYGAYRALSGAALEGYLGEAAQDRTQAQIALSGSLILGGRPEIGATAALFRTNPLGFGPGTVPSPADVLVAKTGMSHLGYDPNNGYVERFMLGQGKFELHSLIGDFWAVYGIAGLVLILAIGALVLRYLGRGVSAATGAALGYFLALRTLWDIGFSPILSSIDQLILTVAVVLLPAATLVGGHAARRASAATTDGTHRRPIPRLPG